MSGWHVLRVGGAKPHFVHSSLTEVLEFDLAKRFDSDHSRDDATRCLWDWPGMIASSRPMESFDVDGLEFIVPSGQLFSCLSELKNRRERILSSGDAYYKLHSWQACYVFTPAQRERLLFAMNGRLKSAEDRAWKFHDSIVKGDRKPRRVDPPVDDDPFDDAS